MKRELVFTAFVSLSFIYCIYADGLKKNVRRMWEEHKRIHKLSFDVSSEHERFEIYKENLKKINEHNEANTDLILGMNQFGHLTEQEFKQFLSRSYKAIEKPMHGKYYYKSSLFSKDIDWRTKGVVSEVKNQGLCGSCWAFSATGALEGQYAKKTGSMVELSEQDLVDCSRSYGNEGCNGGLMNLSFEYVKNHGINSEKLYPYTGKDGACKHDNKSSILFVKDYVNLAPENEDVLSTAISEIGPISVAIDASPFSFQFYRSGVYRSSSCSSTKLNHGVLAVGLGSSPSPHYIIKNSWSAWWGMHGYMLLARNTKNMCGVASAACYPELKN